MTLVAGCLLPDGAILGADCRITWKQTNGSEFQSDNAVKILKLGKASAIGYSGNLQTVSWLFSHLYKRLNNRKDDPVSIRQWIPRFLRDTYNRLSQTYRVGSVSFLVASSIRGKPTRLPKSLVWASVKRSSELGLNNWLALRLLNDINKPGDYFEIPNSSQGMLYEMHSPAFKPIDHPPLRFTAIGSGRDAKATLEDYSILFAIEPLNRSIVWFIDALVGFLYDTEDKKVGGLVLSALLQNGDVKHIGFDDCPNKRKTRVGVSKKDGRFTVHTTDGQEVILKYPGELMREHPTSLIVNDLKTTIPSEVKRRTSVSNKLKSENSPKKE